MDSIQCPRCGGEVWPAQKFCASCGASLSEPAAEQPAEARPRKRRRRLKPKTIRLIGQAITTALSGAVTGCIVGILIYTFFTPPHGPVNVSVIVPRSFHEETPQGRVNASALVPIADSTFLVVDDQTDDAFYELRFTPEGTKSGPLVRRPIVGLKQGHVEDFEGATLVEVAGLRFIAAVSSLEANEKENTEEGLVRVTIADDGTLHGETMPGFRTWLVSSFPELAETVGTLSALNVQGLAWDPNRGALVLGVRFPTRQGTPYVLVIRLKDPSGPWETTNLERIGTVMIVTDDKQKSDTPKGVLDIARFPERAEYLAIFGDSVGKPRNAALYVWDGGDGGQARRVPDLVFHPEMKPEGIAFGTIGGKPAVVLVDDDGGYHVVWEEQLNSYLSAGRRGEARPVAVVGAR